MTIVLVSWSKHNILDFGYLLLPCSYFKSTTKHLVSAKIMLLVSEGVVISPPLSSLTLYGGDITPFLEHYGEGGGFPPRGWYPPLVLIWPWATGVGVEVSFPSICDFTFCFNPLHLVLDLWLPNSTFHPIPGPGSARLPPHLPRLLSGTIYCVYSLQQGRGCWLSFWSHINLLL